MATEGGIHKHAFAAGSKKTEADGKHTHIFVIDGSKVESEMGGGYQHDLSDHYYGLWGGVHAHKVVVGGEEMMTLGDYSGWHSHEVLTGSTTESGLHEHTLQLSDGTTIDSVMPGEDNVEKSADASVEETPKRKLVALADAEVAKRGHGPKPESIWKSVLEVKVH